jgi:hypothetical protein
MDNPGVPFLTLLLRNGAGPFELTNERTGGVVATDILTAFDSETRRTGLLKHTSLPAGSALIIAPTNAIHTFFMRFAIDVAFVRKDGVVVKTYRALEAWRIAWAFRAHAAVELPAGALDQAETRAGDRLVIVPAERPRP